MTQGLSRSIHDRLIRHAQALGVDPNLVLNRYGTERLLYRLSRSTYADRFILKGGLMMLVWLGETFRPTRDADLLGFGELDNDALANIFDEICAADVESDGLVFDTGSIRITPIRREDPYGGQRVTLIARLGSARLRIQVDIGIGDVVIPDPVWLEYPSLLDLPQPHLRAYRPETTIAEKVHAMVELGSTNSRMRDFFDVYALAMQERFEGNLLVQALRATLSQRRTTLPDSTPIALTPAFVAIEGKRSQWGGFVKRNRLTSAPETLDEVVAVVSGFAAPLLTAIRRGEPFPTSWPPGGPWRK